MRSKKGAFPGSKGGGNDLISADESRPETRIEPPLRPPIFTHYDKMSPLNLPALEVISTNRCSFRFRSALFLWLQAVTRFMLFAA